MVTFYGSLNVYSFFFYSPSIILLIIVHVSSKSCQNTFFCFGVAIPRTACITLLSTTAREVVMASNDGYGPAFLLFVKNLETIKRGRRLIIVPYICNKKNQKSNHFSSLLTYCHYLQGLRRQ